MKLVLIFFFTFPTKKLTVKGQAAKATRLLVQQQNAHIQTFSFKKPPVIASEAQL